MYVIFLSARSNLTPTPPKPQKGDFKYFVKWDDEKTGGRYFECNILKNVYGNKYEIKAHDGDRDTFDMDRIFKIGCTPGKGDSVIAYWDDRSYAFLGKCFDYFIAQKFFGWKFHNSYEL